MWYNSYWFLGHKIPKWKKLYTYIYGWPSYSPYLYYWCPVLDIAAVATIINFSSMTRGFLYSNPIASRHAGTSKFFFILRGIKWVVSKVWGMGNLIYVFYWFWGRKMRGFKVWEGQTPLYSHPWMSWIILNLFFIF